ncbi:MAG TPA: FMN-binding protein [Terriglobia bacterium]|nr:FMN-binding protein [Terriglobia bacterium]
MRAQFFLLPLTASAVFAPAAPAYATVYLSVEQAQALIFPGASFEPDARALTMDQAKAIEHLSGVNVRDRQLKLWRVSTGGWFIVDEVVGKHEFIPFALGLDDAGGIKGIEILEYREAYGGQIREPGWRRQFVGLQPGFKLELNKTIRNVSGATLSCKHITDGVNRLLAAYEIVIKQTHR